MDYNLLIGPKTTSGTIASWVNYSDAILPLATILTEAQALIYKSLRCREMIVSDATLAVAQGDLGEPLPAGFLDPLLVRDLYANRMRGRDLASIKKRRGLDSSGAWIQSQPHYYAIAGATMEFDCAADASAAGTYYLDYYGTPAALSPTNLTNFLTNRYPTLLRYACMAMAADFLNDAARRDSWGARVAAEIAEIEANDDLSMRGAEVDPDYGEAW